MRPVVAVALAMLGCGERAAAPVPTAPVVTVPNASEDADCNKDDQAYAASPAWSGRKPSLPTPPDLPETPTRIGDSFTVHGAVHALRSRYESSEVTKGEVSIVGYIIDTNIERAPRCAIHRTGIADPPNCTTEIPAFTIADRPSEKSSEPAGRANEKEKEPAIRVLGWSRNFAVVYEAQLLYSKSPPTTRPSKLYTDEMWAVDVPWPLPGVGAKVKVTGRYGFTFTKSSTGLVADPKNGVLTFVKIEYLEPAKPAVLKL